MHCICYNSETEFNTNAKTQVKLLNGTTTEKLNAKIKINIIDYQ